MPALNPTKLANAIAAIDDFGTPDQLVIRMYTATQDEILVTIKFAEALDIQVSGPLTNPQKNELIAALVGLFKAP